MRHHSSKYFVASRLWAGLLLSLLVCGSPFHGYATEVSFPTKEVDDVLGQAVQAAGEVRHPFFRADIIDPIASAYAEIGRLERALELAERKDNVSKDRTLLAITQMLVEQGQSKQAGDIASRIENGYWKASALQKLGRYHISKGEKEAALERFTQALKAAESIGDSFPRVRTMLGIAEAQAAGGDRVKAEETLRQVFVFSSGIQDAESRDLAIGYVAEGQAKLGDVAGALRTVDGIMDGDEKSAVVRNIVGEVARNGNIRYAKELAGSIPNGFNHDFALRRIVEAQAHAGDFNGALATAGSISRIGDTKAIALSHIADEMIDRQDRAMVQSVLRQAAQAARQISDARERAYILGGIARRQAEVNDRQGAVDNIRLALRAINAVSDREERDSPLIFIVEAQVQAGDLEGAWKSASAMSSDSFQDRAYSQIAKSQAWLGDIEGALQAAAMIHGSDFIERGFSPRRIAKIQAHKGDKKGALAWATTQAAPSDRALALLGAAEGILREGKPIDN